MPLPSLRIPGEQATKQLRPFSRVKQVRDWIARLPMANRLAAANQLLLQLRAMNNAQYAVKDRHQFLHELQPLGKQLYTELRHSLHNAAIPLSKQQLQTSQTLHQLLEAQATGYKIIVNDLALEAVGKKASAWMLQESLYLAIKYLSRQLVITYALYQPEAENVWHELHQLYCFAEDRNLHSESIDDTDPDSVMPVPHTIEFAYKRIVLLRLTEPYHLLETEAEHTYQLLSLWAASCTFHRLGTLPPQGEYIIDQASDLPPRYIPPEVDYQPQQGILIDITETRALLNQHLQRMLRATLQEVSLDGASLIERRDRDMLLRLSDALSTRPLRHSKRFPLEGKVQVTLGLNACHYHLTQRAGFTPQMDELKLRQYSKEKLHPDDSLTPFASAYRAALEKDRGYSLQEFSIEPWWQQNISPLGISLSCTEQCAPRHAKVGQIAAYRVHGKQSARWQLGVIRWLRTRPALEGDGTLELGMMNLANGAVAVGIKAIRGTGAGTDYYRSLMIPRQTSVRQSRSLIVPALIFDVNTVMAVNMKQRMFYLRLSNMLLATRDFAQFEFEIMERPPEFLF
ncbi:MAG: hypothetical protein R6X06_08055 [Gammaproteobacteria bacterium]